MAAVYTKYVRCFKHGRNLSRALVVRSFASSSKPYPVVIVGGGVGGLATAVGLHKNGIECCVLERTQGGPRGAALGLWANAWRALDALGVGDEARKGTLSLSRVELCSSRGKVLKTIEIGEDPQQEFRGIRRDALLQALSKSLPEGVVRSGIKVLSVDQRSDGLMVLQLQGADPIVCEVLIGADGARSRVAEFLGLQAPKRTSYSAYRGVGHFPEGLPTPLTTIRQIWGSGIRAGLYPLSATDVYWYTCFNDSKKPSLATSTRKPGSEMKQEAAQHVKGWSWGVDLAVAATPENDIYFSNCVDRWTEGTFGKGTVTLVGDAAHPMTPNLGQGACTALEDAVELSRALYESKNSSTLELMRRLRKYEMSRSVRCYPIAIQSAVMGVALQIANPLVCFARNVFVEKVMDTSHFLDHTYYHCGYLTAPFAETDLLESGPYGPGVIEVTDEEILQLKK